MIVVDVETTGTEPGKHSLLSLGAVDFSDPAREFYQECRIWDGAHVDPEALTYNGVTEKEITDPAKKSDKETLCDFLEWLKPIEDHTLVGQNVFIDHEFLRHIALRNHLDWPLAKRILDIHSVCYAHMAKRGLVIPLHNHRSDLDSDKICRYVGIPAEEKPHRSPLGGVKWEAEAISRLLYDRPLLPEFKEFPIPWLTS